MKHVQRRAPMPLHVTQLGTAQNALRPAITTLRNQIKGVKETVDGVTWTGQYSKDVKADLELVYKDLREQATALSELRLALATHGRWLQAERTRLAKVEQAVKIELEQRKDAGEVVPDVSSRRGWDWDEVARVYQIEAPRPTSNTELQARGVALY